MRGIKFRAWDKNKMNVRKGSKGMYKQNGYILAKAEYHPYCNSRGYVPLHRLIMENELGRYLTPRKELVHHIDGDRSNNSLDNLKLTTPQEHYINEHFTARNKNGYFAAKEPKFSEIKYRLYDRDKNITQIYTLQELISTTYRRAKFEYRGTHTGLKDKNGKEIYEGDVLKESTTHPLQVFIDKGHTQIAFKDMGNPHVEEIYQSEIYEQGLEVIGNVFEDKHLILFDLRGMP